MEDYKYIVIGDLEEIKEYERKIDFTHSKDTEHTDYYYSFLEPDYQDIIDKMILTLTESKEHIGYNLTQIHNWFRNSEASIHMVYKEMISQYDLMDFDTFEMIKLRKKDADVRLEKLRKTMDKTKKQIAMTKGAYTDKGLLIDAFCDYCMISSELIFNGIGEIYIVADEFLNEDNLIRLREQHELQNEESVWNTKLFFETLQHSLKRENPNIPDIITTKYAAIKKRGSYEILKSGKSYEPSLRAVRQLIKTFCDMGDFVIPSFVEQ